VQSFEALPNVGRQVAVYSGLKLVGQPPTQKGRAVMRWHVIQDLAAKITQIIEAEIVQVSDLGL